MSCLTIVANLSCLWNVAYEMENQEFFLFVFLFLTYLTLYNRL